jgi:hypothetical protein
MAMRPAGVAGVAGVHAMTVAIVCALAAPARADDDFAGATVIFARGDRLFRIDPRGKTEVEIASFGAPPEPPAPPTKGAKPARPAKPPKPPTVRALATDAAGKVLLADLDGSWQWMPLDGSAKTLAALPCADGPAQLAEDGTCVLCRAATGGSMIVNLKTGKQLAIDIADVRVTGMGTNRRLVWADRDGVWSAPPSRRPRAAKPRKVAPEAPLRSFLPSPDGSRALGVYADEVYVDAHHKKPADVLMGFELDGRAARRKAIKSGVPLAWSHDSEWVLVQDGSQACLMHATGGEYKCWRGYTAASISSDGKFGLFLGNRDGSHRQTPAKPGKHAKHGKHDPHAKRPPPEPPPAEDAGDDPDAGDDVAVPPPSGPLSLFRARLEGSAFTESPALVVKIVDGAAVWVPGPP